MAGRIIAENAYLWIYCFETNTITKYSDITIRTIRHIGSNAEHTMVFFDGKRNTVSAKEMDPCIHAGYYWVWSKTDDDKKARLATSNAVIKDIDKKIYALKKQMDRYFEIRENVQRYLCEETL